MFKWSPYPFVRYLAALIAGIVAALFFTIPYWFVLPILTVSAIGYFIYWFFRPTHSFTGFFALLFLCCFGYLITRQETTHLQSNITTTQASHVTAFRGVISEAVNATEKGYKLTLTTSSVKTDTIYKAEEKLLVYVNDTSQQQHFNYGDELVIKRQLSPVRNKGNPGEFDYKGWLAKKGIHYTTYCTTKDVIIVDHHQGDFIKETAIRTQTTLLTILKQHISSPEAYGILAALTLGYKDAIEATTKQDYTAAGATHILAVSGLHVGMLYLLLHVLFSRLDRSKTGRYVSLLLTLIVIWGYAFITGMSPSVTRAATMFSTFQIGNTLGRHTSVYNSITFSAFALLCIDPLLIRSPGFQLSYAAVISIVFFYQKLYYLFYFKYALLDKIWSITSVSIAAQIGTLPIMLYYFHQLPVYSLVANLVAIPGAFGMLLGSLALFAFSWLDPVADLLGLLLNHFTIGVNWVFARLHDLPFSMIKGIYLTPGQLLLLYGLLITTIALFTIRKMRLVYGCLLLTLSTCCYWFVRIQQQNTQKQWVIYNIRGKSALGFTKGRTLALMGDTLEQPDLRYVIQPHKTLNGIRKHQRTHSIPIYDTDKHNVMCWEKQKIVWFKNKLYSSIDLDLSAFDYLIISHNALQSLQQLNNIANNIQLVLDASNNTYIEQKLYREATERNIPVHSVIRDGAFILEIE